MAKHFPGHGDTGVDSHFGLPELTHTLEQIHQIDLPPFKADIAAGKVNPETETKAVAGG